MANVEASGDIWRGRGDDEDAFRLDLAVRGQLRREEALRVPPVVPSSLDSDRVVASGHRLREVLSGVSTEATQMVPAHTHTFLLAFGSGVHERSLLLFLLLLLRLLLACRRGRGRLGCFGGLQREPGLILLLFGELLLWTVRQSLSYSAHTERDTDLRFS